MSSFSLLRYSTFPPLARLDFRLSSSSWLLPRSFLLLTPSPLPSPHSRSLVDNSSSSSFPSYVHSSSSAMVHDAGVATAPWLRRPSHVGCAGAVFIPFSVGPVLSRHTTRTVDIILAPLRCILLGRGPSTPLVDRQVIAIDQRYPRIFSAFIHTQILFCARLCILRAVADPRSFLNPYCEYES